MTQCTCLVQEGQISQDRQSVLRHRMTEFAIAHFGSAAEIAWIEVAKNNGFTAGKPSNSVLIMMEADRPLQRHQREPMLKELGDVWMDISQLGADEVVTVIRDPQTRKDA